MKVEWKRDRMAERQHYRVLASIANGLLNFQAKFLLPKFCNDALIEEFNTIWEATQEEMDIVLVAGTAKHGWRTSARARDKLSLISKGGMCRSMERDDKDFLRD